jgi:V8-like Glu-specific endopeptidase
MKRFFFFSWVVVVAACSENDARERVTRTSSSIISGTKDTTDVAVVQVLIQHASNPTADTSFQCSGTVVSPHVVVTAAHCLSEALVGPGQSWYVFYGSDSNDDAQLGDRSNFGYAKSVTAHPDFDPGSIKTANAVNGDIGVIVLRDKAPVTPIALRHDTPKVGEPVHALGYGMSAAGDASTSGVRNDTTSSIAEIDARSLSFDGGAHSMCEGDSGGPSLVDGKLAGVHSYIQHATSCTGMNYDVRVDAYADWIETTINTADPGFLKTDAVDAGLDAASPSDDAGAGDPGAAPTTTSSSSCAATPRSDSRFVLALGATIAIAFARRRRSQ